MYVSGGCNIAGSGFHLRIPRGAPAPSVNASGKHRARPVEAALGSFLRLRICASQEQALLGLEVCRSQQAPKQELRIDAELEYQLLSRGTW